MNLPEWNDEEKAKNKTMQAFSRMCEFICYGRIEVARENMFGSGLEDDVFIAYQFLFGQYLKKSAYREQIPIQEYAMALSPTCGNDVLKTAREKGYIPKYKRRMAKKFRIKNNCCSTGTAYSDKDYY